MLDITVYDLMTAPVTAVSDEDNLLKVWELFNEGSIHHLPVLDKSENLCGIVSDTDLNKVKYGMSLFRNPDKEQYNQSLLESTLVGSVMTKDVQSIRSQDSIMEAYRMFKENKYHAIPVMDRGHLVGIVTPMDLVDYLINNTEDE